MATRIGEPRGGLNKWRILGWGGLAALLATPLVAMQFTSEVQWTGSDFIAMGVLFALVGGTIELAVRASSNLAYRLGAALAVLGSFLLIWVNLAVGFIGDEDNPQNLMYFALLGLPIAGAFIARSNAAGMARAMLATAAGQALITAIAWFAGLGANDPPGAVGILMLNSVFVGLWLLAALLFRNASEA